MPKVDDVRVRRQCEPGTVVTVDSWDDPNAPDWANGALKVKRINRKQLAGGIVEDEIMITTEEPDRIGDIVVATGMQFEDYWGNPVVGWNHGQDDISHPIAKTIELSVLPGRGVRAKFVWPPWHFENPKEGVEVVDDIHKLWDGRFINAASIWFQILEADPVEGYEDYWWPPLKIHSSKLMEWALVYVPMNAGAVRRALKRIGEDTFFKRTLPGVERWDRRAAEHHSAVG